MQTRAKDDIRTNPRLQTFLCHDAHGGHARLVRRINRHTSMTSPRAIPTLQEKSKRGAVRIEHEQCSMHRL